MTRYVTRFIELSVLIYLLNRIECKPIAFLVLFLQRIQRILIKQHVREEKHKELRRKKTIE